MSRIINLCFLLAVFYIWPNDASEIEIWKKNAKKFAVEVETQIKTESMGNAHCSTFGLEQISFGEENILEEFVQCCEIHLGRSQDEFYSPLGRLMYPMMQVTMEEQKKIDYERCLFEKEKIFHSLVDNIREEARTCGNIECLYLKDSDEEEDSILSCENDLIRKTVIERAANCSYFIEAGKASDFINSNMEVWPDANTNYQCFKKKSKSIRTSRFEAIQKFRGCKEAMIRNLNANFTETQLCSSKIIYEEMQKMSDCSKIHLNELVTSVDSLRLFFLSCRS